MSIPLNTYALVSTAETKNYLTEDPLADLGEKEDLINRLINSISVVAETYMNRKILTRVYTDEDYDGTGTETLYLKNYPVTTLTSVYLDNNRDFTASHLIAASDLILYADEGVVKRAGITLEVDEETGKIFKTACFTRGNHNVRVTYTAGYSTTPDDIKLVILEEIVWHYDRITKKKLGVTGVSAMGEHTSVFVGNLLPSTELILSAYRRQLL